VFPLLFYEIKILEKMKDEKLILIGV